MDAVFSRCGLFLNAIIMRARRGAVSEIIAIRNGLFSWVVGGLTAAWVAPRTGLDISRAANDPSVFTITDKA